MNTFSSINLRPTKNMQQTYTSEVRLYLNSAGKLCDHNDPDVATLLVAAGGSIPIERAIELGLLEDNAQTRGIESVEEVSPSHPLYEKFNENQPQKIVDAKVSDVKTGIDLATESSESEQTESTPDGDEAEEDKHESSDDTSAKSAAKRGRK